jgi:hypothetical protein
MVFYMYCRVIIAQLRAAVTGSDENIPSLPNAGNHFHVTGCKPGISAP